MDPLNTPLQTPAETPAAAPEPAQPPTKHPRQSDGSGIRVVSWLLAILLLLALIILSEYIFFQIRRGAVRANAPDSISEIYFDNGGTIQYRPANDQGNLIYLESQPYAVSDLMTEEMIEQHNRRACENMRAKDLDQAYSYYNYIYADSYYNDRIESGEKIIESDLANSDYAACIDLNIMAQSINERIDFESSSAFSIPLRQLFFVVPFFIIGIMIFLFVDRKSQAYRVIGFPYLGAVLWVGVHYLIELGVALYKIAPEYGPYVILGAVILLLSGLIWWLQVYLKKRQDKTAQQPPAPQA